MEPNQNNQKNRKRFFPGFVRSVFNKEDPYLAAKVLVTLYLLIFLSEYLITGNVSVPPVFIAVMALIPTYVACQYNEQLLLQKQIQDINREKDRLYSETIDAIYGKKTNTTSLQESHRISMSSNTVVTLENASKFPDTESKSSTE